MYAFLMAASKLAVAIPVITLTIYRARSRRHWRKLLVALMRGKRRTVASVHEDESSPDQLNAPVSSSLRSAIPPAAFIGVGMIARGEIGLLIAQIAHSPSGSANFGSTGLLDEELFLVCIWAILLCTLIGPICSGFILRRWGPDIRRGMWR